MMERSELGKGELVCGRGGQLLESGKQSDKKMMKRNVIRHSRTGRESEESDGAKGGARAR